MAKITLKKPYLVEGKVLAKGTKLIIRESDEALDNYEALENSSDISPNEFDIEKARRLRIARLRKMRAIKKAEEELLDEEDENLEESDFPSEEVLAMRKARRLRLANLKKAEGEEELLDEEEELLDEEEELLDEEEEDESPVEAMRKARIARIKRMKRMKRMKRNRR